MIATMSVGSRYKRVAQEVAAQCQACDRDVSEVTVLAVSKTVGLEEVQEAIDAGACAFGENRPDELMRKAQAFPDVAWHFIGNIQSRRIKDIVAYADLIHSVYKPEHLAKIDAAAAERNICQSILLEVNVSGEESKSGLAPKDVFSVLKASFAYSHLCVVGLMTMAPRNGAEVIDETFSGLRSLQQTLQVACLDEGIDHPLPVLSMGMTEDWPEAIAEGSTIVRIGRAIFDDAFE